MCSPSETGNILTAFQSSAITLQATLTAATTATAHTNKRSVFRENTSWYWQCNVQHGQYVVLWWGHCVWEVTSSVTRYILAVLCEGTKTISNTGPMCRWIPYTTSNTGPTCGRTPKPFQTLGLRADGYPKPFRTPGLRVHGYSKPFHTPSLCVQGYRKPS